MPVSPRGRASLTSELLELAPGRLSISELAAVRWGVRSRTTMSTPAPQEFNLVDANWRDNAAFMRKYKWLVCSVVVFLFVLFAAALSQVPRAAHDGLEYFATVAGLGAMLFWFFLVGLFQAWFAVVDPPTHLRIDARGLCLVYQPGGRIRYRLEWTQRGFRLLIRDFRPFPVVADSPNPLANSVVLDTGDRNFLTNVMPMRVPPSGFLTQEAFSAILEAARMRGFEIRTTKDTGLRASPGWFFPDVTTRIAPPSR